MIEGMPDRALFQARIGSIVSAMQTRWDGVRVFGEMVDLLWQDDLRAAAARIEEFWNDLRDRQPFALLCGYGMECLAPDSYAGSLQTICRSHTHLLVHPNERAYEHAVNAAVERVLGPSLAGITQALAANSPTTTEMPSGQSMLMYLNENMPVAADRVLQAARAGIAAP
jgi:hypothetical protein